MTVLIYLLGCGVKAGSSDVEWKLSAESHTSAAEEAAQTILMPSSDQSFPDVVELTGLQSLLQHFTRNTHGCPKKSAQERSHGFNLNIMLINKQTIITLFGATTRHHSSKVDQQNQ